MRKTTMSRLTYMALTCAMLLTLAACSDNADEASDFVPGDKVAVELTLRMRVSTLANEDDEEGSTWENYINISGDDYRIYFFTSNNNTPANNTLLAELEPTSVYSSTSGTDYVTYTIRGELDASFATNSDFKVVVAANWGTYPEMMPGTTTMWDLCTEGTYAALVEDGSAVLPSASKHIPFYGVQDYTGVSWELGHTTDLSSLGITMVRAMAKVEVVLQDDTDPPRSFSSVSMNNYSSSGYCAPLYYNATTSSDTYALHIGSNMQTSGTFAFVKTLERETDASGNVTQYETWTAYVPEYDNSGTEDYSTITATFDNEDGSIEEDETTITIYFGNYYNGECTAYGSDSTTDRFDISRNYYYRFAVSDPTIIAGEASSRSRNSARRSESPLSVTSEAISLY